MSASPPLILAGWSLFAVACGGGVVIAGSNGVFGADGGTTPGTGSGSSTESNQCVDVNASSFATSCTADSDCSLVLAGEVCTGSCNCPGTAVNASGAQQYQQDIQGIALATCRCATGAVACIAGTCTACAPGAVACGIAAPDAGGPDVRSEDAGGGDISGTNLIEGALVPDTSGATVPPETSVCAIDPATGGVLESDCTGTSATGSFKLQVPSGDTGIFATDPSGEYVTSVWPAVARPLIAWNLDFRTVAHIQAFAAEANSSFGPNTGAILFHAYAGESGAWIGTLAPDVTAADDTNGTAPAYVAPDGTAIVSGATSTNTSGSGFFFGLPEGTYDLTFTGSGLTCTRDAPEAWSASGATLAAPVYADTLTIVWAICAP